MENDHFERQIKAKLDCWEVDPPADMWNRIQKELPTANTPSKQAIIYRYAFWGAAAAMLAGIILWVTKPSEVLIPESTKTFTQNSPTHVLPYSTTSKEQTTKEEIDRHRLPQHQKQSLLPPFHPIKGNFIQHHLTTKRRYRHLLPARYPGPK